MPTFESFIHERPAHWHMKLPVKPDAKVPKAGNRRFTEQEIAEIRRVIEYLLERKFIQQSESRFSSAVLLVCKPDGTIHLQPLLSVRFVQRLELEEDTVERHHAAHSRLDAHV